MKIQLLFGLFAITNSLLAQKNNAAQIDTISKIIPIENQIQMNELTHDFGEVKEGVNAECDFIIKNISKDIIVIKSAYYSFSGDIPSWSKEPILPKRKGFVHVTYHTAGRVGHFDKRLTMVTNVGVINVQFKGTVIKNSNDKRE